jgi:hypothetical protein
MHSIKLNISIKPNKSHVVDPADFQPQLRSHVVSCHHDECVVLLSSYTERAHQISHLVVHLHEGSCKLRTPTLAMSERNIGQQRVPLWRMVLGYVHVARGVVQKERLRGCGCVDQELADFASVILRDSTEIDWLRNDRAVVEKRDAHVLAETAVAAATAVVGLAVLRLVESCGAGRAEDRLFWVLRRHDGGGRSTAPHVVRVRQPHIPVETAVTRVVAVGGTQVPLRVSWENA